MILQKPCFPMHDFDVISIIRDYQHKIKFDCIFSYILTIWQTIYRKLITYQDKIKIPNIKS